MANYFSHDSNARNSDKIIRLRMKHKAAGYGVYFMILERLREEEGYMSVKDYNMIAFDLREDASLIKSVVEDFGLFVFTEDGEYFYSESFNARMEKMETTSENRSIAGKIGAEKRWGKKRGLVSNNQGVIVMEDGKTMANAIETDGKTIANAIKSDSNKIKENKINNNNPLSSDDDKSPFDEGDTASSRPPIPYQKVVDMWNAMTDRLPGTPRVAKLTDERRRKVAQRLKEMGEKDIGKAMETYQSVLERIPKSQFFVEKWKPSFDWLFANGSNWVRIIEGNYGETNRPRGQTTSPPPESVYEQNRRIKEELLRKYSGNGNSGEDTADKDMSGAGQVPGHPEAGEDVRACRASG